MDLFLKDTQKAVVVIDFKKIPQKSEDKMDLFLKGTLKALDKMDVFLKDTPKSSG